MTLLLLLIIKVTDMLVKLKIKILINLLKIH